ncbi:MAG: tetratricopeptide repeat protein [Candidatus Omnitrophica bacterium]|nr:tetratricopeptide repeat protein [Candidatus Omnitrophota bacterium]
MIDKIISHYLSMLAKDPGNEKAYYSLGVLYIKIDNHDKALYYFTRAVDLNPSFQAAVFNLASINDSLGKKEGAILNYNRLLTIPGLKEDYKNFALNRLKALEGK